MLDLSTKKIVDVKPPLKLAIQKSKSKKIGILATKSAIESKGLVNYIQKNIPKSYRINFPSSVTEILPGCGSA